MTGRGMGYCAGYPVYGYMNPYLRYGFGRGYGLGRGCGRGLGFGKGRSGHRAGFRRYPFPMMMPYGHSISYNYAYPTTFPHW
jgi:hypothetical protein